MPFEIWNCKVNVFCLLSFSREGYQGDGFQGNCDNIDECAADPAPCHANAACQDTTGSFECICHRFGCYY